MGEELDKEVERVWTNLHRATKRFGVLGQTPGLRTILAATIIARPLRDLAYQTRRIADALEKKNGTN